VALGASFHFHGSFPGSAKDCLASTNPTLKTATDAAIKSAID
jgi:hypothetical protein